MNGEIKELGPAVKELLSGIASYNNVLLSSANNDRVIMFESREWKDKQKNQLNSAIDVIRQGVRTAMGIQKAYHDKLKNKVTKIEAD